MSPEDQIREWDRDLAPGSESPLLADALENLRRCKTPEDTTEALDWWRAAYRFCELAEDDRLDGYAHVLSGLWEPEETYAEWRDDATLLRLRIDESGLTNEEFAERVLLRERRQLQRWLSGESTLPKRLRRWLEHPLRHPWP